MAHLEKSDEYKSNDSCIIEMMNSRITTVKITQLSGGIAQLVERLPCTQEVSGSSPLTSTLTNSLSKKYNQLKSQEISTQTV
jgi:hypothetical protein